MLLRFIHKAAEGDDTMVLLPDADATDENAVK